MAQLVEWSLLAPEIRGLNLVISKILSTICVIEKTKITNEFVKIAIYFIEIDSRCGDRIQDRGFWDRCKFFLIYLAHACLKSFVEVSGRVKSCFQGIEFNQKLDVDHVRCYNSGISFQFPLEPLKFLPDSRVIWVPLEAKTFESVLSQLSMN